MVPSPEEPYKQSGRVKASEDAQDYQGPTSIRGRARSDPVGAVTEKNSRDAERQRRPHPGRDVKSWINAEESAPDGRPAPLGPQRRRPVPRLLRPALPGHSVVDSADEVIAFAKQGSSTKWPPPRWVNLESAVVSVAFARQDHVAGATLPWSPLVDDHVARPAIRLPLRASLRLPRCQPTAKVW